MSPVEVIRRCTADHGGVVGAELEGREKNLNAMFLSRLLHVVAQTAIGGNPTADGNGFQVKISGAGDGSFGQATGDRCLKAGGKIGHRERSLPLQPSAFLPGAAPPFSSH